VNPPPGPLPASPAPTARRPADPVPPPESPYWQFYAAVATAQLAAWLPDEPGRVLDLSGCADFTAQLLARGAEVVHVRAADDGGVSDPAAGRLLPVVADRRTLDWLAADSVDLVLAESRSLSMSLAAEVTVEHLARVLRPGGRLLLVVDSLTLGLARLADQGRWAELADVPSADVVLVPAEDGTITRCFWPEELHLLLADAGLDVEWVRPRTVLTPATVERALQNGGTTSLRTLVRTELALAADREGESSGLHLVVSARKA
jgi:SAM-dependent methyltransferase